MSLLCTKLKLDANKPMVEKDYWDEVQTGGEIEEKYMELGNCVAKKVKYEYVPNGYMVAWFRYHLMNDEYAGKAFSGENAEILNNENWQDGQSKWLNLIE